MLIGVVSRVVVGVGIGILVSLSSVARQLLAPSVHILRMTPFLAMIPLFNLWFGAATFGIILFVAYGVAVIMFIGAVNAVGNVAPVYFDRAATAGAGLATQYRLIVMPAIVPDHRCSSASALPGASWWPASCSARKRASG